MTTTVEKNRLDLIAEALAELTYDEMIEFARALIEVSSVEYPPADLAGDINVWALTRIEEAELAAQADTPVPA